MSTAMMAAGGSQEGEKNLMHQTSHVATITVVGKESHVDAEASGL